MFLAYMNSHHLHKSISFLHIFRSKLTLNTHLNIIDNQRIDCFFCICFDSMPCTYIYISQQWKSWFLKIPVQFNISHSLHQRFFYTRTECIYIYISQQWKSWFSKNPLQFNVLHSLHQQFFCIRIELQMCRWIYIHALVLYNRSKVLFSFVFTPIQTPNAHFVMQRFFYCFLLIAYKTYMQKYICI